LGAKAIHAPAFLLVAADSHRIELARKNKQEDRLSFWTLIRRHWGLFLWTTVAASTAQVVGIPLALLTRRMIKMVAHEAGHHIGDAQIVHNMWIFGVLVVGLSLLRGVARGARALLGETFAQRTIADLRKAMLERIHYLSMGYFDRRAAGKIVIRFVGDALGLRGWLSSRMVSIPADILTVTGALIAIGTIHVQLVYAVMIPPFVLFPLLLILNPRARYWTRQGRGHQSRLTGNLTDRVNMISEVKSANAQQASLQPLFERVDSVASAFIRRSGVDAWAAAVGITSGSLSICGIGIWGSVLILHGQQTSGDILGAIWLSVLLRAPLNRLTRANVAFQRVAVGLDRINALLTRRAEPGWDDGLGAYTGLGMRIELRGVGYRDRHNYWLLRGVTQTLSGPGCIAVRGSRHATHTLCELILRIRRPHEGRIALDGVNAKKLRVEDIRRSIRWVDARRMVVEATLLTHSIDEISTLLGSTRAISGDAPTLEEMQQLQSLERHANVAGAKGLRLALACALIDDPPILLIDQPELGLENSEIEGLAAWVAEESKHRLIVVCTNKGWVKPLAKKVMRLEEAHVSGSTPSNPQQGPAKEGASGSAS